MHNSPTVRSPYSNNLISPIQHLTLLPGAIDKHGLLLWIDQPTHLGAMAQTIMVQTIKDIFGYFGLALIRG
jgi:hypothetical protein